MALRSLRTLTAAFLLTFVVVTLGTAIFTYNTTLATIDRLVRERISDVSEAIAPDGNIPPTSQILARARAMVETRENGDIGFIVTQNGKTLFSNVRIARALPTGFQRMDLRDRVAGLSHGWALTRNLGEGRTLSLIAETEPFDDYHQARIRIYFIGFGAIAAVAMLATLIFGTTISRRIREMRRTVDAIIDGDLTRRIPTDGSGSEFDGQAIAFNRMLDRIEELMAEVQNVSNGIAHELRTPLARLRNQIDLLLSDPEASNIYPKLGVALGEADRLLSMFSAILRMAEIESGTRRAGFVEVDLAALGRTAVANLHPIAEDKGQHLGWDGRPVEPPDEALMYGDPRLLTQMILTLIENAITHTPQGSRITLSLTEREGTLELSVTDNGPGIAGEDRAKALTRFGRLHKSMAPGHGLGLPLAASIARLHGGTLSLGDAAPGLRVTIRLPRREDKE